MTFSVTHTQRDSDGNAGRTEQWGNRPTLDQTQALAEQHVQGLGQFWWKQFSETTWGLMDGQRYTYILVSDLSAHHARKRGQRMSIDAKEAARKIVLEHTEDIDFGVVGEHFWLNEEYDALPEAEQDKLCRKVHDLMGQATVLVILPGDEYAKAVVLLLRDFADMIDRGPDIPLPPSIYSALARETAEKFAGPQAESEASA